jgi:drug/metabolite transporter (DMT)-like permease
MMNRRHRALPAIILCVLLWGFSFISIKAAVSLFPPMTLGALRFALALIFLFPIKWYTAGGEKLTARDLPWLLGSGLTGVTLYFFFENNGVALVSVSEASIIVGAIPVITMAAEWLARRSAALRRSRAAADAAGRTAGEADAETAVPGARRWLGAILSVAGVVLVVLFPGADASGNIRGYLYMAGAALSWVAYCFLTGRLVTRRSRIYIVFWQNCFGFLGFLPFAVLECVRKPSVWFRPWGVSDLPVLFHVGFLGIFCTALGYWLYAQSLEVLGVAVSSVFINLIPVVTVAAGFFLLGDRLGALQWAGAALVISGVYLAVLEKRPRKA